MVHIDDYLSEQILGEIAKVGEFLLGTEDAYTNSGENLSILHYACSIAIEKLNGIQETLENGTPLVIWDRSDDSDGEDYD